MPDLPVFPLGPAGSWEMPAWAPSPIATLHASAAGLARRPGRGGAVPAAAWHCQSRCQRRRSPVHAHTHHHGMARPLGIIGKAAGRWAGDAPAGITARPLSSAV